MSAVTLPPSSVTLGDVIRKVSYGISVEVQQTLLLMRTQDGELRTLEMRRLIKRSKRKLQQLYGLMRWLSLPGISQCFRAVADFNNQMSQIDGDMNRNLDELYFVHASIFSMRSRPLEVLKAKDILACKSYNGLPSAIVSCGKPTFPEVPPRESIVKDLNLFIRYKLATEDPLPRGNEMPIRASISDSSILSIRYPGYFELSLTLKCLSESAEWNVLNCSILPLLSVLNAGSTVQNLGMSAVLDADLFQNDLLKVLREATVAPAQAPAAAATQKDERAASSLKASASAGVRVLRRLLYMSLHAAVAAGLRCLYTNILLYQRHYEWLFLPTRSEEATSNFTGGDRNLTTAPVFVASFVDPGTELQVQQQQQQQRKSGYLSIKLWKSVFSEDYQFELRIKQLPVIGKVSSRPGSIAVAESPQLVGAELCTKLHYTHPMLVLPIGSTSDRILPIAYSARYDYTGHKTNVSERGGIDLFQAYAAEKYIICDEAAEEDSNLGNDDDAFTRDGINRAKHLIQEVLGILSHIKLDVLSHMLSHSVEQNRFKTEVSIARTYSTVTLRLFDGADKCLNIRVDARTGRYVLDSSGLGDVVVYRRRELNLFLAEINNFDAERYCSNYLHKHGLSPCANLQGNAISVNPSGKINDTRNAFRNIALSPFLVTTLGAVVHVLQLARWSDAIVHCCGEANLPLCCRNLQHLATPLHRQYDDVNPADTTGSSSGSGTSTHQTNSMLVYELCHWRVPHRSGSSMSSIPRATVTNSSSYLARAGSGIRESTAATAGAEEEKTSHYESLFPSSLSLSNITSSVTGTGVTTTAIATAAAAALRVTVQLPPTLSKANALSKKKRRLGVDVNATDNSGFVSAEMELATEKAAEVEESVAKKNRFALLSRSETLLQLVLVFEIDPISDEASIGCALCELRWIAEPVSVSNTSASVTAPRASSVAVNNTATGSAASSIGGGDTKFRVLRTKSIISKIEGSTRLLENTSLMVTAAETAMQWAKTDLLSVPISAPIEDTGLEQGEIVSVIGGDALTCLVLNHGQAPSPGTSASLSPSPSDGGGITGKSSTINDVFVAWVCDTTDTTHMQNVNRNYSFAALSLDNFQSIISTASPVGGQSGQPIALMQICYLPASSSSPGSVAAHMVIKGFRFLHPADSGAGSGSSSSSSAQYAAASPNNRNTSVFCEGLVRTVFVHSQLSGIPDPRDAFGTSTATAEPAVVKSGREINFMERLRLISPILLVLWSIDSLPQAQGKCFRLLHHALRTLASSSSTANSANNQQLFMAQSSPSPAVILEVIVAVDEFAETTRSAISSNIAPDSRDSTRALSDLALNAPMVSSTKYLRIVSKFVSEQSPGATSRRYSTEEDIGCELVFEDALAPTSTGSGSKFRSQTLSASNFHSADVKDTLVEFLQSCRQGTAV